MRVWRAELSKLVSLPSVWAALAAGLLIPSIIAGITASAARTAIARGREAAAGIDTGYQELAFGVIGVIILGVVAISSEYFTESEDSGGGRQITATLTAVPSRLRLLLAKASAVVAASAALSVGAAIVTMTVVQSVLGEYAPELSGQDIPGLLGVVCYWALTALLSFGITVLVRHGVLPLAILIANTSVVSVTYLLTRLTPLANYLPDMAGIRMFIRDLQDSSADIAPLVGGLVMAAWTAALLAGAALVFCRRDA